MYPRNLKKSLLVAAGDTPVVMVNGSRQTGKSTLIQHLFPASKSPEYVSLDNLATLDSARSDPQRFIENLPERVIIDEIQRAPELMLPIKYSVDQRRRPGRFFLTGSANVLALPKVADTLVGRIEVHTLWPLSQGEIQGQTESFIDTAFSTAKFKRVKPIKMADLTQLMCTGAYPDVLQRDTVARRKDWFTGYINTLIERDVRDLRNIEQLTVMPRLLQLIATRAGGLLNYSDLSRSLEINLSTLKNYLALLELLFLVVPIQPWFGNIGKRLVKAPKLYMNDTGLLSYLLNADAKAVTQNGSLSGMIFENFVVMELLKQIAWSEAQPKIYHFRTEAGQEVDIVLETRDGRIVGIECKSAITLSRDAFKGLNALKQMTGKKFHRGIILYAGDSNLAFENYFEAIPVSAIWETTSGKAPTLI
ncbi:MAG: ATP-binding protein [Candidatus Obscuribacterales bacterium]|nr:ATP-binding protein [Candidatus Obscuribacterales bacterium]